MIPFTYKTFDPVSSTQRFEPTSSVCIGLEFAIPTFAVVTKTPEPIADTFDTTRTHGHAAWLLEQLRSFVAMREGMSVDVPWPKNDQHALCSQKWCPAWDTCKGQHIR